MIEFVQGIVRASLSNVRIFLVCESAKNYLSFEGHSIIENEGERSSKVRTYSRDGPLSIAYIPAEAKGRRTLSCTKSHCIHIQPAAVRPLSTTQRHQPYQPPFRDSSVSFSRLALPAAILRCMSRFAGLSQTSKHPNYDLMICDRSILSVLIEFFNSFFFQALS